jgi:hypothetical protein
MLSSSQAHVQVEHPKPEHLNTENSVLKKFWISEPFGSGILNCSHKHSKIKKAPLSKTLLVLSILDEGCLACIKRRDL